MTKILLIDDDEQLGAPLATYFERYDLQLEQITHPEQGLEAILSKDYQLVILDIMLPDMDGFEVCRELRKTSDIPVVMLTARGEVMDRVIGLELGADDYLPKPFEPRELVARIQTILKRTHLKSTSPQSNGDKLEFGSLSLDLLHRQVQVDGKPIELSGREFQLLALLANEPGRNYSRDQILNELRGIDAELFSRSVDILVSRLRNKLKPLDCIKTNWGSGYCFVEPVH
ncbi:MAG: response regulator transcription factor [Proteobacteria bacterium]|nr:response regulator transcription factor [Pseudomonadota bacterium]